MTHRVVIISLAFSAIAFAAEELPQPRTAPIPERTITATQNNSNLGGAIGEITRQSQIVVDCPAGMNRIPFSYDFKQRPFWSAVEDIARATKTRIVVGKKERRVELVPEAEGFSANHQTHPTHRVTVKQVKPCRDFELGRSFVDLTLELHWEPRFPVYRVGEQPKIDSVRDDRGSPLACKTEESKVALGGVYSYTTNVRIEGIPRAATKIALIRGAFTATATDRMIPFEFDFNSETSKFPVLGRLPKDAENSKVSATVEGLEKVSDMLFARVNVRYPKSRSVIFESFESGSWVTENRIALFDEQGKQSTTTTTKHTQHTTGFVAVYRFKAKAMPKSWRLIYETPAPLREFSIPFELRDIPLP